MILVVDDDKVLVRSLSRLIEKSGYTVKTASNGLEAYEIVKQPSCKCMLLDINMPKLNGVELLMLMQADGVNVPTIVMAGFDDFDADEMKEFESVVAYMHKPFDAEAVLEEIKKYVLN